MIPSCGKDENRGDISNRFAIESEIRTVARIYLYVKDFPYLCRRFENEKFYFMTKALKIVVLAKQVPDTRNVGKDAMTPEGTVNRAALPAIFNPEDLNALEQALRLK